jgi:hypothetical protein
VDNLDDELRDLYHGVGKAMLEEDRKSLKIKRGSDEGKEPERAVDEPTTPNVAAPAKQPHNTTISAVPNDMPGHRRLSQAVILQAIEDKATHWSSLPTQSRALNFGVRLEG